MGFNGLPKRGLSSSIWPRPHSASPLAQRPVARPTCDGERERPESVCSSASRKRPRWLRTWAKLKDADLTAKSTSLGSNSLADAATSCKNFPYSAADSPYSPRAARFEARLKTAAEFISHIIALFDARNARQDESRLRPIGAGVETQSTATARNRKNGRLDSSQIGVRRFSRFRRTGTPQNLEPRPRENQATTPLSRGTQLTRLPQMISYPRQAKEIRQRCSSFSASAIFPDQGSRCAGLLLFRGCSPTPRFETMGHMLSHLEARAPLPLNCLCIGCRCPYYLSERPSGN